MAETGSVRENSPSELLWEDAERAFFRLRRDDGARRQHAFFPVTSGSPQSAQERLSRLEHEYELKEHLDSAWALRPVELLTNPGQTALVVEFEAGQPLDRIIGPPMEVGRFLRLALAMSTALGQLHGRGLIHKDIKPANVIVDEAAGRVWLTGFGIASRLPRERQALEPPEIIAGTLAYMAPEQTGRMNRSIDSRSDLYALGVTFYQMLTGVLPFTASDPMEWVHCHIARQAVPPTERVDAPSVVSALVMKLLAKTAEDRYQTAAGLSSDLKRCLAEHQSAGAIGQFSLGERDVPGVLRIPEKLYGRTAEVTTLLAAFERVVESGTPAIVVVRGYPGVGKSSVVNELHKVIVPPRGLFASGKFEQYRRDVPYATLAQAFQTLVGQLLVKSEAELNQWRDAVSEALGGNGELMVAVIPELEHLIGKQPAVPELPPREAQRRFEHAFRQLLRVFARREHPLVLFLDDLQWLDAATLSLLVHLATHPDVRHVMLVGAYRDNEVDRSHPLRLCLEEIRRAGAVMSEVVLNPLDLKNVRELISDALRCEANDALDLAKLVCEKTGGNPFFVIQFLGDLEDENLLRYDARLAAWTADLDRIRAKGYTDNVVDLMADKLGRLPPETLDWLKRLACLGSHAGFSTLGRITDDSLDGVHAALWHAEHAGLLVSQEAGYAFVHDRVQEAAYSLIPQLSRPVIHLAIGRALLPAMRPDEVIDVVDHLNRGKALITDKSERLRLAELNLRAGLKAKSSAAYASAVAYLSAGMELLDAGAWQTSYRLSSALWLQRAECEFMSGGRDRAETLITELLARSTSALDKAVAYRLKTNFHVMRAENPMAIESARASLRLLGVEIPARPTNKQVEIEIEKVWRNLDGQPIESLLKLPRVASARLETVMGMLSDLFVPALYHDRNLLHLSLSRMVNLTLENGFTDASASGFSWFGVVLGARFDRFQDGYRFAEVARDLVERLNLVAYRPRVYYAMEVIALWAEPPAIAIDLARAMHRAGVEGGDISMACYGCTHLVTDLLLRGDRLEDVWPETERGLEFCRKARFMTSSGVLVSQQRFITYLQGKSASFPSALESDIEEAAFEEGIAKEPIPLFACWYWIMKMRARYLSGNFRSALDAGRRAEPLLWSTEMLIQVLDYYFYRALTVAAAWESLCPDERRRERRRLARCTRRFEAWVKDGGVVFRDRSALLQAEVARIENRLLDAERSYEEAIRLSREHRFVQNEALANELAGRFYSTRGFLEIGALYLRNARDCYLQWGAGGKARQLEHLYPRLRVGTMLSEPTSTIHASVEHLDLATVIRVSEAVSGEIVLETLIDTLMRLAVEHAGAERGVMVVPRENDYRIEAEVTSNTDRVTVAIRQAEISSTNLPESLFRYVVRTKEIVVLQDAANPNAFSADDYIRERHARSVLCLPILRQNRMLGVLYLENKLTAYAFTPARVAILKLLASEAASSLENARLYRDLAERERRIRRLVDANIIGIIIYGVDGRIVEANDAFLSMVGYSREDLEHQSISWTDLTPPEWLERDRQQLVPQLMMTGSLQPFEKEYFRKDGSRVPVLIGVAKFEDGADLGVAFVLDLTERKSAAEALRALHAELAHANRLSTMGQLAASIAHEVNQPIGAARNNAHAALRFLSADPPDLAEVNEALRCVVNDTYRAGEIISRIRDQVRKVPVPKEDFVLNEAIQEVIALARGELAKNRVALQTQLTEGLPSVRGDRVQLQQVMLNLMVNAIEAMAGIDGEARELIISSELHPADGLCIAVCDSGPGIAPNDLERVFNSFYTTKPGGVGIGLSICHSIIKEHGGRLWAEPHRDRGAVFKFTLPPVA